MKRAAEEKTDVLSVSTYVPDVPSVTYQPKNKTDPAMLVFDTPKDKKHMLLWNTVVQNNLKGTPLEDGQRKMIVRTAYASSGQLAAFMLASYAFDWHTTLLTQQELHYKTIVNQSGECLVNSSTVCTWLLAYICNTVLQHKTFQRLSASQLVDDFANTSEPSADFGCGSEVKHLPLLFAHPRFQAKLDQLLQPRDRTLVNANTSSLMQSARHWCSFILPFLTTTDERRHAAVARLNDQVNGTTSIVIDETLSKLTLSDNNPLLDTTTILTLSIDTASSAWIVGNLPTKSSLTNKMYLFSSEVLQTISKFYHLHSNLHPLVGSIRLDVTNSTLSVDDSPLLLQLVHFIKHELGATPVKKTPFLEWELPSAWTPAESELNTLSVQTTNEASEKYIATQMDWNTISSSRSKTLSVDDVRRLFTGFEPQSPDE
jgi:hypothetical protein